MKEMWKDIQGYEGLYQVSNLGKVKCIETGVVYNSLTKACKVTGISIR